MKVTLNPKSCVNVNHRKESKFQEEYSIIAKKDEGLRCMMVVRIYGTQAMNYCCLWLWGGNLSASGSGKAGGYGYHRPSAAVQGALVSAGFSIATKEGKSIGIDGRGDSAIIDFMSLVAEQILGLTKENYLIHKAHA